MIKVLNPGMYTSIQDKGRFGFAKMGVAAAGAMDAYAAELANVLLQNDSKDAILEITFGQGVFEFTTATFFSLTGGDFSPKLNSLSIALNRVYFAEKGSILFFERRHYGARTYLAVQGGIRSTIVFGSRSFSPGITKPRLEKGDELNIKPTTATPNDRFSKVKIQKNHFISPGLECSPGPEFDRLNNKQKQQLFESFTISEDNNRVGYRLNEPVKNDLQPILTSAVLAGTVQLTPSGKLIVLMRDGQVTGGYPRVLQLSEYAISRLGQKITGEKIQFKV
ncbi:MAG: allophanate hydrolase subunit 2 family protein [Flavobacteriaceae bacterium]|nr:MAG: allophanate hydrolase subunit 2 family protein [Flavobacteriaceae bacterium]